MHLLDHSFSVTQRDEKEDILSKIEFHYFFVSLLRKKKIKQTNHKILWSILDFDDPKIVEELDNLGNVRNVARFVNYLKGASIFGISL